VNLCATGVLLNMLDLLNSPGGQFCSYSFTQRLRSNRRRKTKSLAGSSQPIEVVWQSKEYNLRCQVGLQHVQTTTAALSMEKHLYAPHASSSGPSSLTRTWGGDLAIEMHNGFRGRDTSKEIQHDSALRWTRFISREYCALLQLTGLSSFISRREQQKSG